MSSDEISDSDSSSDECLPAVVTKKKQIFNLQSTSQAQSDLEDLFPALTEYEHSRRKLRNTTEFRLVCRLYVIMAILFTALLYLFFVFINRISAQSSLQDGDTNRTESKSINYQLNLDPDNKYRLFWTVDYDSQSVLFELRLIENRPLDWFAFGFSDYGSIANADLCLLWYDRRKKIHFDVRFSFLNQDFLDFFHIGCQNRQRHFRTSRFTISRLSFYQVET